MEYIQGRLHWGGVDCLELVNLYGTPLLVTDEQLIRKNFREFRSAFPDAEICYALKANPHPAILAILASEGAGAEIVSPVEFLIASKLGIPPQRMVFNGNAKSDEELELGIRAGIRICLDSLDELLALNKIASQLDEQAQVLFRINPMLDPKTHPKVSTGSARSKFGILKEDALQVFQQAQHLEHIRPLGLSCHIGSQILDINPFVEAASRLAQVAIQFESILGDLKFLDLGGGLGISYRIYSAPTPAQLASGLNPVLKDLRSQIGEFKLILEPGRYLVGNSSILICRVNSVKYSPHGNFLGIDAGMNLMPRYALYQAYHHIVPLIQKSEEQVIYNVVGPLCESGDIIGEERKLPKLRRGDLVAILDVGAYCFSMSSNYNSRPRCPEVLVNDGNHEIITYPETPWDLIRRYRVPTRIGCWNL